MCLDKRSRDDVHSVDGALHLQAPAAWLAQKPAPISGSAARLPEHTELLLPTRGHFPTAHGQIDPCNAYQKGSHCFCPSLSFFFSVLTKQSWQITRLLNLRHTGSVLDAADISAGRCQHEAVQMQQVQKHPGSTLAAPGWRWSWVMAFIQVLYLAQGPNAFLSVLPVPNPMSCALLSLLVSSYRNPGEMHLLMLSPSN